GTKQITLHHRVRRILTPLKERVLRRIKVSAGCWCGTESWPIWAPIRPLWIAAHVVTAVTLPEVVQVARPRPNVPLEIEPVGPTTASSSVAPRTIDPAVPVTATG